MPPTSPPSWIIGSSQWKQLGAIRADRFATLDRGGLLWPVVLDARKRCPPPICETTGYRVFVTSFKNFAAWRFNSRRKTPTPTQTFTYITFTKIEWSFTKGRTTTL